MEPYIQHVPRMMKGFFNPTAVSFELVYALIVVLLCFFIYYKTKDIYSLTKHKGIGFFRNTFLFFGLAFAFRFLFSLFLLTKFTFHLFIPMRDVMSISLVIIGYLSTMAIFSLTLSSLWKKVNGKYFTYLTHILAIVIAILVFLTRSVELLILSQLALMIYAIVLSIFKPSKSKNHTHMLIMYILLFVFWLLNLTMLIHKVRLIFSLTLISYVLSIGIFVYILFRVGKWTK